MFVLVFDTGSCPAGGSHYRHDCGTRETLPRPWHCHSSLFGGKRLTRSQGYTLLSAHCKEKKQKTKPSPTLAAPSGPGFSGCLQRRDRQQTQISAGSHLLETSFFLSDAILKRVYGYDLGMWQPDHPCFQ